MALFKSFLAGLAGTVVAAILGLLAMLVDVGFWAKSHHIEEGSVGIDSIRLWHSVVSWAVLLCGFTVCFAWEYRRATRRPS